MGLFWRRLAGGVLDILNSRKFLIAIIILFVLESLWIAFSFRYPMLYDEGFHISVIKIFSHQWSPFITNQPTAYDYLGDLSHANATLYHYLMSFPYRVVSVFSLYSLAAHVIALRVIDIIMVTVGLVLYARLFRTIGIKRVFVNVALLLFILLPIVPFVAATVNYDDMLFPLTAYYLILCVNILKAKNVSWKDYSLLVIVGCFASLVKYTFLPIFAFTVIYLAVVVWRRHGRKALRLINKSYIESSATVVVLSLVGLVIALGLFSGVYVKNIALYGSPEPTCTKTMSLARCMKNGAVIRNVAAISTRNSRPTVTAPGYTADWVSGMLATVDMSGTSTAHNETVFTRPILIIEITIFILGVIGACVMIVDWRNLKNNQSHLFLIMTTLVLFATVFYVNYSGYLRSHVIDAVQARYLIGLLPVLMVIMVVSLDRVLKKTKNIKITMLLITLLLFTQGGGIITHIVLSNDFWYWNNSVVYKINENTKRVLHILVIGA